MEQEQQPVNSSKEGQLDQKPISSNGKRFRLYIAQDCLYSQYFKDILRHYPAVFRLLEIEIWQKGDKHPLLMRGTPCILDMYHEGDHWNGNQCLQWLRRAIVLTADFLPLGMPSHQQLRQLYSKVEQIPFSESSSSSSSSSSLSAMTPSPEIDQNQEETASASSSNECKEEWK